MIRPLLFQMNHWMAHVARCSYRARLFSIGQSYEGRMTLGIAVSYSYVISTTFQNRGHSTHSCLDICIVDS